MSDPDVVFTVAGTPVPQGSSRAFAAGAGARIVSTTRPLLAWRSDIATEARRAMDGRSPMAGPVGVFLHFRPKSRPASHFHPANSRRPEPVLRADAPEWCDTTPDADKLARAALDAMTGVVFHDDRQVVRLTVTTRWPAPGDATGVDVTVMPKEQTR